MLERMFCRFFVGSGVCCGWARCVQARLCRAMRIPWHAWGIVPSLTVLWLETTSAITARHPHELYVPHHVAFHECTRMLSIWHLDLLHQTLKFSSFHNAGQGMIQSPSRPINLSPYVVTTVALWRGFTRCFFLLHTGNSVYLE